MEMKKILKKQAINGHIKRQSCCKDMVQKQPSMTSVTLEAGGSLVGCCRSYFPMTLLLHPLFPEASSSPSNRIFSPAEILSKAIFCAREWIVAQPSHSAQTASAIRPPQATTETTCYTDAAWSQATNRAGCGWCFMNHENVVFLQDARAFEFISSPLMAEAIAIRSALLHALKAEILEICIKSDCQALIVALSSKRHPADLYGITRDIKTLSLRFTRISFCFISRSLNSFLLIH
ncbi:hypothetical protein Bca101_052341 [Brassica carinata]